MSHFRNIQIDSKLVAGLKAGDSVAFDMAYRQLSPAVFTTALRLVGNRQKAEDVLQDTFLEVMRSISGFREEASLATWVRRIAVSKALMLLRTAWESRSQALSSVDEPRASLPQLDSSSDLSDALARLDSASRTVVWLHDVEGFTHREIGELMNQSTSFSKSRLARAHQSLRESLVADYRPCRDNKPLVVTP